MASISRRIGLGTLGLLTGLAGPRLTAQSWSVLASDPVGIARSGAGVAYGNSLEAAALNPALLASLRDRASAFVAIGQELQITHITLQSNSTTNSSTDRNRSLPSFGAAWHPEGSWALGVKLDEPFMRHLEMPVQAPVQLYQALPMLVVSRFEGQALSLETHRLEAQAAWSCSPSWSFGASLGMTQIQYDWANMVRVPVTETAALPVSATNPAQALMELGIQQGGSKVVPSYSLGFRWAISSRWTVAGAYVSALHANMDLHTGISPIPAYYYATSGYGQAPIGISSFGPAIAALSQVHPGSDRLVLPGKATLGLRQRVNSLLTWEADLRYTLSKDSAVPGYPSLAGPNGTVSGSGLSQNFRNAAGASVMGELTLSKTVVLRIGCSEDGALRATSDIEPMLGGGASFTASGGFGYKVFGGELNLGYMFRKSQTVQNNNLDLSWDLNGQHNVGDLSQVEGMGHLWSVGFKKAF